MEEQFRVIEIDYSGEIPKSDINLIDKMFKCFPTDDFTYELFDEKAIVYLNSLDIDTFKEIINNTTKNSSSTTTNNLLNEIYNKIDSIKSYGLKGKKEFI